MLCERHVQIRDGVANCTACENARRKREDDGPISRADADRLIGLLGRDVLMTLGQEHSQLVTEAVARNRLFCDAAMFEQSVVDDVQQNLHDSFIHTSWPSCPQHAHHPLWFSHGWWYCERSGTRVARLGELQRAAEPS
jgi:hypothetical protein